MKNLTQKHIIRYQYVMYGVPTILDLDLFVVLAFNNQGYIATDSLWV